MSSLVGTLIGTADLVAQFGIGWEPHIRGMLTVALAMTILGGSVWLLLVTNTGTRLGSLIAIAGFWGWMFVMGIFWWIYGIGWVGSSPSWEVQDRATVIDQAGSEAGGLGDAFIGNVNRLPDANCADGVESFPPPGGVASVSLDGTDIRWARCTPRAINVLMTYDGSDRETIARELLNPQGENSGIDIIINRLFGMAMADPQSMLNGLTLSERDLVFDELVAVRIAELREGVRSSNEALGSDDPRYVEGAELVGLEDEAVAAAMLRVDDLTLSGLEGVAPQVNDWAEDEGLLRLGGWTLQSSSEAGEASAAADAFLREDLFPDGNFLILDAYQQGGKDKRDDDDLISRVTHKITSTIQITHPTNYTVVHAQQILDKPTDPSKPPPIDEIQPGEPTYSVVMIRNLGNLRLIPALFTIISLLLLIASCLVLHWRDLAMREKGLDV